MYNKKTLLQAMAELNKAKAPKKSKDVITDPRGQWEHPGEITRIPSSNITMKGVDYPVLGISNTGQQQMMQPGEEYTFPGADYVDEYPQMRKGGQRKKRKTKSIMGKNKLMEIGPLFKDYSKRIFDPNVNYFQDGGMYMDLTDDEIEEYRRGGYIVEDISVPELNQAKKGGPKPYIAKNKKDYEFRKKAYDDSLAIYKLDKVMDKLSYENAKLANDPNSNESDYFKNVNKMNYIDAQQKKIIKNSNVPHKMVFLGSRMRGDREMGYIQPKQMIAPSLENNVGEIIYKPAPKSSTKKSNPSVSVKNNTLEISDPKEYAYRKKMYEDSLDLYNYGNKQIADKKKRLGSDRIDLYRVYDKKQTAQIFKKNLETYGNLKNDPGDKYGKLITKLHKKSKILPIGITANVEDFDFLFKKPTEPVALKEEVAVAKKEEPVFETKTSGHTYEDSLRTYNNYLKRREAFDNVKPDTFKSVKELNDYTKKMFKTYPTDYNLALKTESPKKKVTFSNGQSTNIVIDEYKKPTGSKQAKVTKPEQSKYPKGYQPYRLYGRILDPEVYGYGESTNGIPLDVAQFADTYGLKKKMEEYKKSEKYPWVKQEGGNIKTYRSKDGTITNTITKANGDTIVQVKTKDGKYYEKVKPGLPQFIKDEFKKRADWENRSSGAAQPVDEFWTLPMGMTSAGVKSAAGLTKGLTSLGRNAIKSPLVQATKAAFNTAPSWLPGASLSNAIASYFAGAGANEYIDQNSDVRRAIKNAYDDPTAVNVTDAVGENLLNLLNFSGLNVRNQVNKGVKQLGKYAKIKTSLKEVPKQLPGSNNNVTFYHGGLEPNATLDDIDPFKLAARQQKKGRDYAGFYMSPDIEEGSFALKYHLNNPSSGLHKIELPSDSKAYEYSGSMERIKKSELEKLKEQGYDYIKGKNIFGQPEFVLLNKDKARLTEVSKQLGKYATTKTPLKEVSKQLPGSPNAVNDVQKAGFLNPFAIADRIIPRLPTPLNYVGVESSWNNVSPLNLIPGYGKKLFNKTDKLPVGFRKFGNSLEDVKTSKTLSPKGGSRMGAKQIESEGNWAEPNEVNEAYNGVFEATMNPNIEGSNIKLEKWNKRNGIVGTTKEGDVAIPITDPGLSFNRRLPFSNKYVSIDKQKLIDGKFQLATQLPHVQSLIEKYGLIAGHAIVLGYMTGGKKGAMENLKTVNKYSVDPVIDWSKKQWDSFDKTLNKKKQGGAINDAVYTDLTETEIQDYIKQGYIVEDVD